MVEHFFEALEADSKHVWQVELEVDDLRAVSKACGLQHLAGLHEIVLRAGPCDYAAKEDEKQTFAMNVMSLEGFLEEKLVGKERPRLPEMRGRQQLYPGSAVSLSPAGVRDHQESLRPTVGRQRKARNASTTDATHEKAVKPKVETSKRKIK